MTDLNSKLIPIPRIQSGAPSKNTIEWEVPNKISVVLMLINKIGYTFIAKVHVEKKHWYSSSHKTYTISSANPFEAVDKIGSFLREHGYYIDPDTIEFGEKIGFNIQDHGLSKSQVIEKINKYEKTAKDHYDQAKTCFERGALALKLEEYEAAAGLFKQAINIKPDYLAYAGLSMAYEKLGMFHEAKEALNYSRKIRPTDGKSSFE